MAKVFFPEMKKKLAFGAMRLPMSGGMIDKKQVCEMVDAFIENGFNYFDTAHGYHDGLSETTLKECLTSRHDRSEYTLTDKLTEPYFNNRQEIRPFFEKQLEWCGVEYFDFYLMHALGRGNYDKFQRCEAFAEALELKKEGRIRHLGISFHDSADFLDKILTDHPEIEIVQIQFNYLDYEDDKVQSRKCYEVCQKHDKPILVMEPVKGGSLANLSDEAGKVYDELGDMSYASYAIRFVAGFDQIAMVLSGMSSTEQMMDNISYMKDFKPLSEKEMEAVEKVTRIIKGLDLIPCTNCRYCIEENHCPMDIRIPDLFSCMNARGVFGGLKGDEKSPEDKYAECTEGAGKASDCVKCGMCENVCPQHLEIRSLLEKVAADFE